MFVNIRRDLPLPAAALLISLLLPPELSLNLAGLRLSGYRLVLLMMFLPMLYQLLLRPGIRATLADWSVMFVSFWCFLSLVVHHPFLEAVEKGGIQIVEMFGSYLVARIYITRYEQVVAVAKLMIALVALVLLVSIPESLSGIHFLRGSEIEIYPERIGLHRAYGPFDHPILHGVVCAAVFSYAYYFLARDETGKLKNWAPLLIVTGAVFLSLSAGPYIALAAQIGLAVWDRITKNVNRRWLLTLIGICSAYVAIDLLSSRSPVEVAISYLSFSGQTAYMRLHIFEYGSAEVMRYPWLGIGFHDWLRPVWMPPSVDNFWLLTAMRFGLPALLGIVLAVTFMVWRIAGTPASAYIRDAGRSWGFTMAGFALVGCTVHFWNATFVLFFFLLGSGCWLLESRRWGQEVPWPDQVLPTVTYQPRKTLF